MKKLTCSLFLLMAFFSTVANAQIQDKRPQKRSEFERGYIAGAASCKGMGDEYYTCTFGRLGQCYERTGYGKTYEEARFDLMKKSSEGNDPYYNCGVEAGRSAKCTSH